MFTKDLTICSFFLLLRMILISKDLDLIVSNYDYTHILFQKVRKLAFDIWETAQQYAIGVGSSLDDEEELYVEHSLDNQNCKYDRAILGICYNDQHACKLI